ncbi:GNAT family N-acetyltransferase [Roseibium marinum]|uniref:RimJ/RimL family protein N-acetyltransferase n=1 Tax=Roseibium marinum TaxID=281252 RepID=A0A2S3V2M8_9HYPH|nr:GNAT family N-acetyltransferase [Roseibium marinum]POF34237.1 RimJ/RimL family protein N-acetyltransferase [Roseibium marinum]
MTPINLETDRLRLRPPVPADLERCAELLGDYEVARMLSRVPHPYDLERGRTSLQASVDSWADWKTAGDLGFQIDHEGEMIGGFAFKKLQETPEIGYWLGRPYWGRGFMSEAVGAAIDWLFRNTDHQLVACEAMTENPASLKVAEKLGFREVGQVDCASVSRGTTVPAIRMELTRKDFLNGFDSRQDQA